MTLLYDQLNIELNKSAKQIKENTQSLRCTIYLFNRNRTELILRGVDMKEREIISNQDFYKPKEGLTGQIAETKIALNLSDPRDSKYYVGKYRQHNGPFLGVPIMINRLLCIGVIKVVREKLLGPYQKADIAIVKGVSKQIVKRIKQMNKDASSTHIEEDFDVLPTHRSIYTNLFYENLSYKHNLDELYEYALQHLTEILKCRAAAIFTFNKNGDLERKEQAWFDEDLQYRLSQEGRDHRINDSIPEVYSMNMSSLLARSLNADNNAGRTVHTTNIEKESYFKNDINIKKRVRAYRTEIEKVYGIKEAVTSVLVIPLRSRNRTFGAIRLFNKLSKSQIATNGFRPKDIRRAELLSQVISINILRIKDESKYKITKELNALSASLSAQSDQNYNKICNMITNQVTTYSCCVIRVADKKGRKLQLRGVNDGVDQPPQEVKVPPKDPENVLREVLVSKKPWEVHKDDLMRVSDLETWKWVKKQGFKSAIHVPIKGETRSVAYGTISIYTNFEYTFGKKHIANLEELAIQISSLMSKEEDLQNQVEVNNFSRELEKYVTNHSNSSDRKNIQGSHNIALQQLFKISIRHAQSMTGVDQCLIAKSITNDNEPSSKNYQIFRSLDYPQNGEPIKLPEELSEMCVNNGYYELSMAQCEDPHVINDPLIGKVKKLLCLPINGPLDYYFFKTSGSKDNFYKKQASKYFLLFVLLSKPQEVQFRYGTKRRVTDIFETDKYFLLGKHLSAEISKAARRLNQYDDNRFIHDIVDNIIKGPNLEDTFNDILFELKNRNQTVDGGYIVLVNRNKNVLDKAIGPDSYLFKPLHLDQDNITSQVCKSQRSYTYPDDTEFNSKIDGDCFWNLNKDIKTIHIAPLVYNTSVMGVMYTYSYRESAFNNDNKYLLDAVADQLSVGIQNNELLKLKRSASWEFIHTYKNVLRDNVYNDLDDILRVRDLETQRFKLDEIRLRIEETIEKAERNIRKIADKNRTKQIIDHSQFLAVCSNIKNTLKKDLKDVKIETSQGCTGNNQIHIVQDDLEVQLEHLVRNGIRRYKMMDLINENEGNSATYEKRIKIEWTNGYQNKYVRISVLTNGTSMSKEKMSKAGISPLKNSEGGSGFGFLFLNRALEEMKCLEQRVNVEGIENIYSNTRFFQLRRVKGQINGIEVSFCIPTHNHQ